MLKDINGDWSHIPAKSTKRNWFLTPGTILSINADSAIPHYMRHYSLIYIYCYQGSHT
jgi:hypothetical protein